MTENGFGPGAGRLMRRTDKRTSDYYNCRIQAQNMNLLFVMYSVMLRTSGMGAIWQLGFYLAPLLYDVT